jgi:hypothetical protein
VWLCGPNHLRVQNMQAICDAIQSGKGKLIGIACEKPLARNAAERGRRVWLRITRSIFCSMLSRW